MGMMGMMGGMDMDDMMMDMGDMDGMMDADMLGGSSAVVVDPAENRYVNVALESITGSALRSALTNNSPNDAALAVAKRVPVMMALNMDQRAVHELIATCGSSPLMVEVHQVRLLPESEGGGMGMLGGDGDSEMDMDMGMMGGMMGGMEMGMGGMDSGMGSGVVEEVDETPLDMSVEIYGIIYIYNPPDPVKLGVDLVTQDTVIDGATQTVGGQPVAPTAEATEPPATTDPIDPTTPEATTPDPTTPDATAPDATAPDATAPDATTPENGTAPVPSSPTPAAPANGTTEAVPPVAVIGN